MKKKITKSIIESLFDRLYESKVVYHERHTIIAKLENIKINEEYFSATVIPQIHILKENNSDKFFKKFKNRWDISCNLSHINEIENGIAAYGMWLIWTEPNLVKKIENLAFNRKYKEALKLSILKY